MREKGKAMLVGIGSWAHEENHRSSRKGNNINQPGETQLPFMAA